MTLEEASSQFRAVMDIPLVMPAAANSEAVYTWTNLEYTVLEAVSDRWKGPLVLEEEEPMPIVTGEVAVNGAIVVKLNGPA